MKVLKGCALIFVVAGLVFWLRPRSVELGEARDPTDATGPAAQSGAVAGPQTRPQDAPAAVPRPASGATPAPAPASRPIPGLDEAEQLVLDATNAERVRRGLPRLAPESTLRQVARHHSADMLRRGFFSHDNPDGISPGDRVSALHRRLIGLSGENIWTGSGYGRFPSAQLARKIVDSWMSSPGHRGNILKPDFTHLGVGIVSDGREVRATQTFATVHGLTTAPMPVTIARGSALRPGPVSGSKGPAEKFDLWSARRGSIVAGPFDLEGAPIDVASGIYQLRFYFPDGPRRYAIYVGPRIEVR